MIRSEIGTLAGVRSFCFIHPAICGIAPFGRISVIVEMFHEAPLWAIALDVIGACFATTIFAYPSIFLHELGHVLAARFVGLTPTHLVVGESQVLFQRSVAGVELVVRLVPFSGSAVVAEQEMSRFQTVAYAMAGPAVNGGLAVLIVMAWPYFDHHFTLSTLFIMELAIAFSNLVPRDWEYEGHLVPSDGKRILACFRGTERGG